MVVVDDTKQMRDAVFFEGPDVRRLLSQFWILITLASVIAAAGVAADSTATVIGAMIVAPLMTPVLGTMLSVVLANRTNLTRSLLLVAGGASVAIAIGWLVGLFVVNSVVADTNSQVAERVHPRLIDLVAVGRGVARVGSPEQAARARLRHGLRDASVLIPYGNYQGLGERTRSSGHFPAEDTRL